ncbi:MAG: M56 family metallopeptidase [Planctomycetota bacterium]|jgi:beta-lactamase regulating signal transducer with metallopeptidase domain
MSSWTAAIGIWLIDYYVPATVLLAVAFAGMWWIKQSARRVAVGIVKPTILLPSQLAREGRARGLRAALAHEWAHINNRDLWLLAIGRCLLMVLFAHPIFWWLRRTVRDDLEDVADANAVNGTNRDSYVEEVLHWA